MMQSQTGRVQRRQHIASLAAKEFKREAKKKPQIQYYHQDPDKKNNKVKGGSASKSWDKVTNERPFASSVPTAMKGMFPQKPSKHYRDLGDLERVVDPLGQPHLEGQGRGGRGNGEGWEGEGEEAFRVFVRRTASAAEGCWC